LGETKLKHKRYATKNDIQNLADDLKNLTGAVGKLAAQMVELSAWQTYHILKDTPQHIPEDMRKEILAKNVGLLKFLYADLFRKNPLSSNDTDVIN
jgi:hypothetical protein